MHNVTFDPSALLLIFVLIGKFMYTLLFIFCLIGLYIGISLFYSLWTEYKMWNNGVCKESNTKWVFDTIYIDGCRAYKDSVGNYCYINYRLIDKNYVEEEGDKNDIQN